MKTTVEVDEKKLSRLMELTGIRTKTGAFDYTLSTAERIARRGSVSKKVHQHMKALFEVLCPVDTDRMTWDNTADLAWELDRSGVVLPPA